MSLEIRRRPRAKLDLIEQAVYLAEESQSPDLPERFLEAAEAALAHLSDYPGSGSNAITTALH